MSHLEEFIHDICDTLEIAIPTISYDTSNFSSKTMMAQTNPTDYTIYLKKPDKLNPDILFATAHELRHLWQIINDESLFFSTYKAVDKLNSIEEYNLQIAEIDANAFAGLVMMDLFGLKPLFEGLSDNVKKNIYDRIEYIKVTEFSQ